MDVHFVSSLVVWIIVAILAIWQLLRWIPAGVDKYKPLPYIIGLLPFAYMPILVIALVSALLSMREAFFASIIVLLISFISNIPYVFSGIKRIFTVNREAKACADETSEAKSNSSKSSTDSPSSSKSNANIRVMTLNCRYGHANAEQIIDIAKKYNVDTLLLQEVSETLVKKLFERDIDKLFTTHQIGEKSANDNGGFNAIFTKRSAQKSLGKSIKFNAANIPLITTKIDNITVNFASAHTKSPMRGCAAWSEGILSLSNICEIEKDENSKILTVIAGDFNSIFDHPSFRKLLKSGLRDTAIELGMRLRTWPAWLRWPNITLDHVLFKSNNCFAKPQFHKSIVIDGTDHLAYITYIRLSD
ncbi:endonuclease/exonuclease/phosphatase family protein [Gardnerella vaginalis]|uniref:endonuclease/exonuclease/phosphatase family protein n=1 Tax=Gardnerella vaginalis TaxID=2702 RepID=UPI0039EEE354